MTDFSFSIFNLDSGAYIGELIDYTSIRAGFEYSAISSFTCDYPATGRFYSLIDTDVEIVCYFRGTEVRNGRWVIRGLSGATVSDTNGSVQLAGLSIMDLLRKVLVYASTPFAAQTAGAIWRTLQQTAATRGAFGATAITTSTFSNTLDSNGAAWNKTFTITYAPGATLRQVLEQLVQRGLVDYEFVGRDLRMYNFGTMGANKDVVLSAGRHVSETPFKESTEDRANVVLVEGDNSTLVERTASGVRREEVYTQQSGVTNVATLNVVGDSVLAGSNIVQLQKTIKIPGSSAIEPFQDFIVGDFVIYDDGVNAPANVRVRQVALEVDSDGIDDYSVTLNDLILEADIKRAIALQAITGGVGGGTIGEPTQPPTVDTTIPSAPASCSITSATYLETDGQIRAQITVTWAAVTTNTDATAISDLDRYEVQYFTASSPLIPPSQWSVSQIVDSSTTTAYFGPFAPGSSVTARVRAVDTNGNEGAYTASSPTTVVSDTTPPVAPSTPAVVTQFRGIQVTWNGLDNLGNAMAGDFDHLDLHVSTTSGFTPTTGTKVDSIRTRGGVFSVQGLTYGTTYFAKLVAYDTTGNASAASAQASATPQTLVSPDVPGLFITNAMIAALAVDDAKIATVSAGKITVGTLVADITLSARIKTANTGARVEMNSGGLQGYSASANVFNLDTAGGLYMSGQLDAGSITGGTIDIPSPLVTSPAGRVHVDDDGFTMTQEGTTNLVPNPSFETTGYVTAFNSTSFDNTPLVYQDTNLNAFFVSMYGKQNLKTWNTAAANGFVEIQIGVGAGGLAANGTYTYSFHVGTSRIDDTFVGYGTAGDCNANFGDIAIIERTAAAPGTAIVRASGVDTKLTLSGPALGKATAGLPTGTGVLSSGNWTYRWAKTFTMSSAALNTSTYYLRLPAPRTAANGIESAKALCYDGVQVEQKPHLTRYCDGAQVNGAWNGTAHASSSTRPDMTTVWFPGHGDPILRGRTAANQLQVIESMKLGSGSWKGTNFIQIYRTAAWNLASVTWVAIPFDTTDTTRTAYDDGIMTANSGFDFLSQPVGVYEFFAIISCTLNSTGIRQIRWVTQGSTILSLDQVGAGVSTVSSGGMTILGGGGYFLNCQFYQNSGITLTVTPHAASTPSNAFLACVL